MERMCCCNRGTAASLARTARELRPGLAVLLTSGFVGEGATADVEFPLLDKPYASGAMAHKIRMLLDDRPAAQRTSAQAGWAAAE